MLRINIKFDRLMWTNEKTSWVVLVLYDDADHYRRTIMAASLLNFVFEP